MPGHIGYMQLPGSSNPAVQQQQPDCGAAAASASSSSAAPGHGTSLPSWSKARLPPEYDLQLGAGDTNSSTSLQNHHGSSPQRSAPSSSAIRKTPSSPNRKTQAGGPQLKLVSTHPAMNSIKATSEPQVAESPVEHSSSVASAVTPGEEGQDVDNSLGEEEREGNQARAEASSNLKKSYAPALVQHKTSITRKVSLDEEVKRDEEGNPGSDAVVGISLIPNGRKLRSRKMSVKKMGSEDELDKGDGNRAGNASTSGRSPAGLRKRSKTGAKVDKKVKAENERGDASSSSSAMGIRLRTASQRKKPAKWDC